MSIPKPGRRVRGSTTGRPIMVALDVLGRRWMLRVLWELRQRPHTFRALQEACDAVSPTVLNTRLRELKELSLVERSGEGYVLSKQGAELVEALAPLEKWSARWARQLKG